MCRHAHWKLYDGPGRTDYGCGRADGGNDAENCFAPGPDYFNDASVNVPDVG